MERYKQNLHTHTCYCDGADTPEDMVLRAIELGFDTIGFSGHSYVSDDCIWCMTKEKTNQYKKDINLLKSKYKDRINVLCGIEFEIFSPYDFDDYDYVIGSSHMLKAGGKYVDVDESADTTEMVINTYFGGDGMKYAKAYYEQEAEICKYGEFDFVGHFDLVSKYCEMRDFFDVESKEYKNAALEALRALSEKKKIFEVNTGAISRGYRKTPYPAPFILKAMKEFGCTVILTSDCHNKDFLDCHYRESLEYIKSCGFDSVAVMKKGEITEEKI